MTRNVPQNEWKEFFDRLSKERFDWETSIVVLSPEGGAQILSQGLPFEGASFETNGIGNVMITTGSQPADHQTHNITKALVVDFVERTADDTATLDIEQADGTKTLVNFIRPMPVLAIRPSEAILAG